jgi:hypothetical protein
MIKSFCLSLIVASLTFTGVAGAEDLKTIFDRVNTYVGENNYSKALSELEWAKKELEKMNAGKLKTFLPDELSGFKGGETKTSNALGFSNTERTYTKDGDTVKISLIGGSSGAGGMGAGIAQLGQMAAMFGGQGNGIETVRIQGRTATLNEQPGNKPDLSIFLQGGTILKIEAEKGKVTGENLKELAGAMKLDDLESYISAK